MSSAHRGLCLMKLLPLVNTKRQVINALDLIAYPSRTRRASYQDQWSGSPDRLVIEVHMDQRARVVYEFPTRSIN